MVLNDLSDAGKRMLQFLNDEAVAQGNRPHDLKRKELLALYRQNLADDRVIPYNKYMEEDHGFIQWLFPLTAMGVNPQAPILKDRDYEILGKDPVVQKKMKEHFELFLSFMGIVYDEAAGTMEKKNVQQWNSWLDDHHNNLRVSRVLESMANFGLKKEATQFIEFLGKEAKRIEPETIGGQKFDMFDESTQQSYRRFWMNSAKGTVRQKE